MKTCLRPRFQKHLRLNKKRTHNTLTRIHKSPNGMQNAYVQRAFIHLRFYSIRCDARCMIVMNEREEKKNENGMKIKKKMMKLFNWNLQSDEIAPISAAPAGGDSSIRFRLDGPRSTKYIKTNFLKNIALNFFPINCRKYKIIFISYNVFFFIFLLLLFDSPLCVPFAFLAGDWTLNILWHTHEYYTHTNAISFMKTVIKNLIIEKKRS